MQNNSYEFLSRIYDDLMEQVDHAHWTDFVMTLIRSKGDEPKNILELGCGTGNITRELLDRGYEVVGIDISEEMLELAEEKTLEFGDKVILITQDITALDFEVYEIDTVIACNDTFNYILEERQLQSLFDYLYPRIKRGGQFVFDISSEYKLRNILGNHTYGESFEDMAFLWENFYDEQSGLIQMEINIFTRDGNGYVRDIETHYQRSYSIEKITEMLQKSGFREIEAFADFERKEPNEASERIFFSCVK